MVNVPMWWSNSSFWLLSDDILDSEMIFLILYVLCLHFTDNNQNILGKRSYIEEHVHEKEKWGISNFSQPEIFSPIPSYPISQSLGKSLTISPKSSQIFSLLKIFPKNPIPDSKPPCIYFCWSYHVAIISLYVSMKLGTISYLAL